MRRLGFLGIWGVAMAVLGGDTSAGSPEQAEFSFTVETPAIRVSPTAEGGSRILLDGYVLPPTAPGLPELPLKTYRVALPPGAIPRLELRALEEDVLRGVRPRPSPHRLVDVDAEERPDLNRGALRRDLRAVLRFEENREAYASRVVAPPAALGEVGVMRDQRYVEVRVRPVRLDPAVGGVRVARRFEIVVHFDADSGSRTPPVTDDRYEDVYRDAFVNYAQGTTFRLQASAPEVSAATTDAPSGPTTKMKIRANGVVRLDATRMAGTGIEGQPFSQWVVLNRGVEVPLHVNDVNGNGFLDAADWVQFYGKALDDDPKTVPSYENPSSGLFLYAAGDFTDENVYFLYASSGAHARMATRDAAATNVRPPASDFEAVAKQEVDDIYLPLGSADPWYWMPTLASSGGTATRTIPVPLPGLASGTLAARVRANLRGRTEDPAFAPDHASRITFRNAASQSLATNDSAPSFDGRTIYLHDFTWPGSPGTLTSPANVQVEALAIGSGAVQQFIVDWVEVRYRRNFQASGDALVFEWPDADAEFIVSALTSSSPAVYEITDPTAVVRLTGGTVSGAGPFNLRFRLDNDPNRPDGSTRRFVVFGAGAVAVPSGADFASDPISDLRSNVHQADVIVLGPASLINEAINSPLDRYKTQRASRGLTTKVVRLQDAQDEFNDGLAGPGSVRRFLQWVLSTNPGEGWASPKPSYVLLLGDGSYDYKGITTTGNLVPTQILFRDEPEIGYYASDNVLAAVVGNDFIPDVAIGRLPGRTLPEIETMLAKIVDYEQSAPAGNWRRHALFISDEGKNGNIGEGLAFESLNDDSEAFMKRPPHTTRKLRYQTDYGGTLANSIRTAIKASINGTDGFSDGAAVAQYIGHGNFEVFSDDAFFDERLTALDVDDLGNQLKLPWLVVHNCLTGGFHASTPRQMGEDWIKKPGGGGIAVFAPSNLSFNFVGDAVIPHLWGDLYGRRKEREIAIPVFDSLNQLCGQGTIDSCQAYVLLGDPSTRLLLPTVNPATAVVATGGNAQVTLNWTASTTGGVTYDVYRATNLALQDYVKAGSTALTNFTDTGRVNATTYYYAVVALDASGFESRWSNFNSDCAVSGPDCVRATPLNPNPPAPPTGLVVSDPETGAKLNLSWSANVESDFSFYTVHYGTAPGVYTASFTNARNTTAVLSGLQNGTTYYVAITATNTSNKTSNPSSEQSGTPTFVRGVRSPDFITTLRVDKSGANALLSWQAVTTDIYGKSATIQKYEIFRATTPNFVAGPATKIGETTLTSFTDTNALSVGSPNHHWLVRAVDAAGNVGGAGYQLPNGIDTLAISKSGTTPGNLVLSWPAVTTDFDGKPTRIANYEIYARSTPFRRSEIGTMTPIATITATTLELTPPAGSQYYSVVVVDVHGNKSSF